MVLNESEKMHIAILLEANDPPPIQEIARRIKCSRQAIYDFRKRGEYQLYKEQARERLHDPKHGLVYPLGYLAAQPESEHTASGMENIVDVTAKKAYAKMAAGAIAEQSFRNFESYLVETQEEIEEWSKIRELIRLQIPKIKSLGWDVPDFMEKVLQFGIDTLEQAKERNLQREQTMDQLRSLLIFKNFVDYLRFGR